MSSGIVHPIAIHFLHFTSSGSLQYSPFVAKISFFNEDERYTCVHHLTSVNSPTRLRVQDNKGDPFLPYL